VSSGDTAYGGVIMTVRGMLYPMMFLVGGVMAAPLMAQAADGAGVAPRSAMDSAFARARQLVVSGQTEAGRAVADSILAAATPGTPAYGDALYGHALLAPSASDAQRDYQRIVVEYPLSRHSGDALLQLAQLERSQGNRTGAEQHLQRFLMENPTSTRRAQTGFWLAQLLFEQNDDARACPVLATARGALQPGDVELRNQMGFYTGRCEAAAARAAADSAARVDSVRRDSVARADSLKAAAATARADSARTRARAAGATRRGAHTGGSESRGRFAVQIGAYETEDAAQAAVARLKQRGIEARVDGDRKPFRVRIGRYETRTAAANALVQFRKVGITGFVTTTDGR
jgi:cell division septation protein DedD